VATRVTSRPTGRCEVSGIPGGTRAASHPRRPPRRSFGFVGAFDGRTPQGVPSSSRIRRERPRGRVRRGPVGNPSPTHLDGDVGRASVPRSCRGGLGGTTGGHRPQRCGTAAGEDQTFGGLSLRGSGSGPVLLRETDRPAARRDCFGSRRLAVEKRSEPHVRYRDATSPAPAARRKPSRWCKTTRTERDVVAWQPRPEGAECSQAASAARLAPPREWTAAGMLEKGTSKDRVRGRQEGASSSRRAFACAGRGSGLPALFRARRTRGEGEGADVSTETRRHASVGKTLESRRKR